MCNGCIVVNTTALNTVLRIGCMNRPKIFGITMVHWGTIEWQHRLPPLECVFHDVRSPCCLGPFFFRVAVECHNLLVMRHLTVQHPVAFNPPMVVLGASMFHLLSWSQTYLAMGYVVILAINNPWAIGLCHTPYYKLSQSSDWIRLLAWRAEIATQFLHGWKSVHPMQCIHLCMYSLYSVISSVILSFIPSFIH
jgi:hypothetical protein